VAGLHQTAEQTRGGLIWCEHIAPTTAH
jgi:hypothetical protein